jgi:cell division protease FtsH
VLGDPRETQLEAKEKRRIAIHEAGHSVVAHFTPEVEPPRRVSIIPRGMALGVTYQNPGGDRHVMSESEIHARIRVLMGGYAAERLLLRSLSTGAENDLKEATRLASRMVASFGMSERLGPVYYEHEAEHPFLGQRMAVSAGVSPNTSAAIEEEARKILGRALEQATKVIADHRAEMDRLQSALLAKESLTDDELAELLGPRAVAPDAQPVHIQPVGRV